MFVVEVSLLLVFGADQQWVSASYSTGAISIGSVDLPLRMLVPAAVSLAALGGLFAFLKLHVSRSRDRRRRAGSGGAAADGRRSRSRQGDRFRNFACAGGARRRRARCRCSRSIRRPGRFSSGACSPSSSWAASGRCSGSLIAALLFGLIENLTATLLGPSWSPAVAFGLLLGFLALRPRGLLGAAA